MWFLNPKKRKATWAKNRAIMLPFISILMILLFMHLSPVHNVLTVSSAGQTFLIFAMKDDESFEIIYYDAENGVGVENTICRQGNMIILRTMKITGNPDYVPYEDAFPGAVFTKTDDGYLISGIDIEYSRIDLIVVNEYGYALGFREKLYPLKNYVGDSAQVSISMRKTNLLEVMRFDPGFKRT